MADISPVLPFPVASVDASHCLNKLFVRLVYTYKLTTLTFVMDDKETLCFVSTLSPPGPRYGFRDPHDCRDMM